MFGIQATTILSVGHKPALQELCGRQEAAPRLQFLTGNYGLLAEMEVAEHLTHGVPVMAVLVEKVAVKDDVTSRSGMESGVMGNRLYLIRSLCRQ